MDTDLYEKQHHLLVFKELIENYKSVIKNLQYEIVDMKNEFSFIYKVLKEEKFDQSKLDYESLFSYVLKLNKYIYDIELVLQDRIQPKKLIEDYSNGVAIRNEGCYAHLIK